MSPPSTLLLVLLLSSSYLLPSLALPEDTGILTPVSTEEEAAPQPLDLSFLPASTPWADSDQETISLSPDTQTGEDVPSLLADIPEMAEMAEMAEMEEEFSFDVVEETGEPEAVEDFFENAQVDEVVSDGPLFVNDIQGGGFGDIFAEETQVEETGEEVLPVEDLFAEVEETDVNVERDVIVETDVIVESDVNGETEMVAEAVVEDGAVAEGEVLPPLDVSVPVSSDDPRDGVCTATELDSVKNYFSLHEDECSAYSCVEEKTQEFYESLNLNYQSLWAEGDEAIGAAASLLAACVCRCDMMKCEVDYMKRNASANCFSATVEYCSAQNELFVDKCAAAAEEYKLVSETTGADARWNSVCPGSCRATDPVDGLALPVSSEEVPLTVSAGEGQDTFEFSLDSVDLGAAASTGISGLLLLSIFSLWIVV